MARSPRASLHAVHVEDLLADLLLVGPDALVGVHLLGEEVGHDLDRALAEDVALEDVAQRGLGVHREDQHPVALLGQVVAGGGREGGLAQAALAAEHDVAAVGMLFE